MQCVLSSFKVYSVYIKQVHSFYLLFFFVLANEMHALSVISAFRLVKACMWNKKYMFQKFSLVFSLLSSDNGMLSSSVFSGFDHSQIFLHIRYDGNQLIICNICTEKKFLFMFFTQFSEVKIMDSNSLYLIFYYFFKY